MQEAPAWFAASCAAGAVTEALADRLGLPLIDVPGNHVGARAEPAEFARAVVPLLEH